MEDRITEEFIVLHIVLYFDVNSGFSSSVYLNEDDANNCKGYGNYIGQKMVEIPYALWELYCNDSNEEH